MRRHHGSMSGFLDVTVVPHSRHSAARAEIREALSTRAPQRDRFQSCTDSLVRHLDAAAARIWLVTKDRRALALQANSGAHPAPRHGSPHIPVATPALRSIVEEGVPYITPDAANDPNLKSLHWVSGDMVAYAGYPLRIQAQVAGVLAVFSRAALDRATLNTLRTIADMVADSITHGHGNRVARPAGPFRTEEQLLSSLLSAMRYAIDLSPAAPNQEAGMQILRDRYTSLTRREQEVMGLVVEGHLNKQVGAQLGISEITVKAHRGQVMRKMKAFSLADLVKIAVLLQLVPLP